MAGNVNRVVWSRYVQQQIRPLISLVIPVYNLEDHLSSCLDSITRQKYDDIEVVVVDGKSNDKSGDILDKRSSDDHRLTVIYADRIGPGRARNMGAEHSMGEYIWFVDGDDVVSDDCLTAIADRLELTRPDVLFLGHEELQSDGNVRPGPGHALMARETELCFTLAEEPWVTEFSMASWNKIIRRDFFLSRPVLFLRDWPHEDVPVTCMLLLDASRLSMLNQICYRKTEDRAGSAMAEAGRRHFRILDSYRIVLDEVERRVKNGDPAITETVRLALFHRAIWHYTTIFDRSRRDASSLSTGGYIAASDRPEFFRGMHDHFLQYAPPTYEHPGGFRGIKFRLIKKNAHGTYSILDPLNKLRIKASSCAGALQRNRPTG